MRRVIFQFEDACIYRGQRCIVDHLHWGVRRGTCVAVTGPNRSGKTTVLKAIAGKMPLSKGWIRYFPEHRTEPVEVMKPHQLGWVDFHAADLVLGHPDAFYQQRYYASQTHGLVMARSLLQAHATDVLGMQPKEWEKQLRRLCDQQLFPADLLDRQVQQLSNGELKKLLILKALLAQPELLLLNAPFTGLDPVSRLQLRNMLQQIRQQGVTLVMEVLPEEANDMFDDILPLPMQDKDFHPEKIIFPVSFPSTLPEHVPLFELQDVHIRYGDHQILKQINWRVYPGQRWLICGQNGSGKSTLLSLITTDHPQAYAQRVFWKGKRRGSGETIWDIKREQAHVSPEMHHYLRTRLGSLSWLMQQQAWRISAPGSRSAVEQQALQYLRYWGMEQQAHQPVSQLSSSEQRLLLLIQALMSPAWLYIFDEPCQGLDSNHRQQLMMMLNSLSTNPAFTLLYVTHEWKEIPDCITHMLYLRQGEILYCGPYTRERAADYFVPQLTA